MGDHGRRYGPLTNYQLGIIEDRNPALKMIVPKKLRSNKNLMKNLKENGQKLTTHYDFYATLVEINRFASEWNSTTPFKPLGGTDHYWTKNLIGSPFFHEMKEPRNCASLLIPFEFCICDFDKKNSSETDIGELMAQMTVDELNLRLRTSNESKGLCADLTVNFKDTIKIQVENVFGKNIYQVDFSVLPSGAKYYAQAEESYFFINQKEHSF